MNTLNDRINTKILKVLQPRNAMFMIANNKHKYKYIEDDCLELWIDLSDSVQRRINKEKSIKTSFDNLTLIDNNDKLEVSEGFEVFISLILLLKALYTEVKKYNDELFNDELEDIKSCFYKNNKLRFVSDNNELIAILNSGIVNDNDLSDYSCCYRFYQKMAKEQGNVDKLLNVIMIQELLYEFDFAVKVI